MTDYIKELYDLVENNKEMVDCGFPSTLAEARAYLETSHCEAAPSERARQQHQLDVC